MTNITSLSSLEKLNLSSNDLVDIRPLSSLSLLTHLNISDNKLQSVSPLSVLVHLQEVCDDMTSLRLYYSFGIITFFSPVGC